MWSKNLDGFFPLIIYCTCEVNQISLITYQYIQFTNLIMKTYLILFNGFWNSVNMMKQIFFFFVRAWKLNIKIQKYFAWRLCNLINLIRSIMKLIRRLFGGGGHVFFVHKSQILRIWHCSKIIFRFDDFLFK